jgi:hypothetical protein
MARPWRPGAECALTLGFSLHMLDVAVAADGAVEAARAAQRPFTAGWGSR